MEQRIILAFGKDGMNEFVKAAIEEEGIGQVVGTAMLRKHLASRVMESSANMVLVGDDLVGEKETDEEWLDTIEELRRVDMYIRIVFICKRPEEDIFLAKLALQGVTDIFYEGKLTPGWEGQLRNPPRFEATERFRKATEKATEQLRKRKRADATPEEILQQSHVPQQEMPQLSSSNGQGAGQKPEVPAKRIIEKQIVVEQVKIPSRSIVVASLFEGAGSSIFTRMLAEYIADLQVDTGVLESPVAMPAWFELINAWNQFDGQRGFITKKEANARKKDQQPIDRPVWESWHETVLQHDELPAWADVFTEGQVRYIVRGPHDDLSGWTENDTAHLLAYSRNLSVLFCDVSTRFDDPSVQILLRSADKILAVGGYDVIRTEREHAKYQNFLARYEDKVHIIMNKSTPRLERIYRAEMQSIYHVSHITHVPAMTEMFEIYVEGESFWKSSFIRDEKRAAMRAVMDEIADILLGKDVMRKLIARKKGGLFSRIGSWFTHDEKDVEIDEGTA